MLLKNTLHTCMIEDLTHEGAGVAKLSGIPVFIPGALVGESVTCRIIRVKSRYAIGKLVSVETPSSERVAPFCSVYGQCGGCQLQHLDYRAQLQWKQSLVQRQFAHVGKLEVRVEKSMGSDSLDFRYRHKAVLPFGMAPDGMPVLGFYAAHSHRVVPLQDCPIQTGSFDKIVLATLDFVRDFGVSVYDEEAHRGVLRALIIRRSAATGRMVIGLSVNAKHLPSGDALRDYMSHIPDIQGAFFCINRDKNNVPLSGDIRLLWGDLLLEDRIAGVSFLLGPMSFFQVNPPQAEVLVQCIRRAMGALSTMGDAVIWDLYAGVGTMGLPFAKSVAKVCCLEVVPEAADLCRRNANRNGFQNVAVITGALEESLEQVKTWPSPDVVVLDPPRQGCHRDVLSFLCDLRPPQIVYVSCDPATCARDLALFSAVYDCEWVQPVDMFPMTRHVEVVVGLRRRG